MANRAMDQAPILRFPTEHARADASPERAASNEPWILRHRWGIGMVAATALGSLLWRRRVRKRRIKLEPMSQNWLSEHEYESGQQGEDAWER